MANLKLKIAVILFTLLYFFSSTVAPVFAAITYLYDQNGNMTSDGTKCYEYNEANQQKRVKNCSNNQTIAEYVYDYQGNRLVKKIYNAGILQKTTFSPNDGYETVKLASNSATQNTSYYFVNDQLIAKKNPDGTKNYYHNDHLGSTSVMTSQTGALVEETKYDPWGEVKTGGTKSKFLFTGQEKDLETNLNYYNARYYDSHIRRFTQPDDIIQNIYDPQSLNRYSYVRNNPLRYTDPTGNCWGPIGSKVCGWVAQAASKVWSFAKNIVKSPSAEQKIVKTEEKIVKPQNQQPKIQNSTNIGNTGGNIKSGQTSPQNTTMSGGSTKINISSERLKHVLDGHISGGSLSKGKSIFSNSAEIKTLVSNAEKIEPILQANGNLRRVVDADRIIGTDRIGQPTSQYTVITDMANNLVTTHPGIPGR